MKFSHVLDAELVQEWRPKYVNYRKLKKYCKVIKNTALFAPGQQLATTLAELPEEREFFKELEENIETVDGFYRSQLTKYTDQFHSLVAQARSMGLIQKYRPADFKDSPNVSPEVFRYHKAVASKLSRSLRSLQRDSPQRSPTASSSSSSPAAAESEPLLPEARGDRLASVLMRNRHVDRRTLKEAFLEFYRGMSLLQAYCKLNLTAITKILKKHDKFIPFQDKERWMREHVEPLPFCRHIELLVLFAECEHQFALLFTQGVRAKAMEKLRVPNKLQSVVNVSFRFGLFLGLTFPLILVISYLINVTPNIAFPQFQSAMVLYRMLGLAVLMVWGWAVDMMVWKKFNINYPFIFHFNTRRMVRYQNVFEYAACLTLLWTVSGCFYILSAALPPRFEWLHDVPWQVQPLVLLSVFLVVFVWFQFKSRWWLSRTLLAIVCSPFTPVEYRHFFLADQLVSISLVLVDLEYTVCFFAHDAWSSHTMCNVTDLYLHPIIVVLPNWWRFLQCLRRWHDTNDRFQLINAGKYSTSFFVGTFAALRSSYGDDPWLPLWAVSISISTCYSYCWDITRDWSLGSWKHGMLREKLLYPKPMYYFAMASNLVFRFMWTLTLSPAALGIFHFIPPNWLTVLLAAVEIVRRAQWNLYRLENEQIANAALFRATDIDFGVVPPSTPRLQRAKSFSARTFSSLGLMRKSSASIPVSTPSSADHQSSAAIRELVPVSSVTSVGSMMSSYYDTPPPQRHLSASGDDADRPSLSATSPLSAGSEPRNASSAVAAGGSSLGSSLPRSSPHSVPTRASVGASTSVRNSPARSSPSRVPSAIVSIPMQQSPTLRSTAAPGATLTTPRARREGPLSVSFQHPLPTASDDSNSSPSDDWSGVLSV